MKYGGNIEEMHVKSLRQENNFWTEGGDNMELTIKHHPIHQTMCEQLEKTFASLDQASFNSKRRLIRVEIPVDNIQPLPWLMNQKSPHKTYWCDRRKRVEMAGVGRADYVRGNNGISDPSALFRRLTEHLDASVTTSRYYGGIRFRSKKKPDENWRRFGSYYFVIPRFEILSRENKWYFALNHLFDPARDVYEQLNECLASLDEVVWKKPTVFSQMPVLLNRIDFPNKQGWWKNIKAATQLFQGNKIEKIVLARRSEFRFVSSLNALALLFHIQKNDARAFYFCFQPDEDHAFIGGTPERLYRREHRHIFSEAVAGTRPRGDSRGQDARIEKELLDSEKDSREHRYVVDSIRSSFEKICTWIETPDTVSVLKLAKLQHLYMRLRGFLKKNVDDGEILSALHPTPAVGGLPKHSAIHQIDQLESFDRGWYAGPVGWVNHNAAEFAVAIRSGLVVANKLFLYSGAGIVPGSSPEKEWEEIENKIAGFLKVFGTRG